MTFFSLLSSKKLSIWRAELGNRRNVPSHDIYTGNGRSVVTSSNTHDAPSLCMNFICTSTREKWSIENCFIYRLHGSFSTKLFCGIFANWGKTSTAMAIVISFLDLSCCSFTTSFWKSICEHVLDVKSDFFLLYRF